MGFAAKPPRHHSGGSRALRYAYSFISVGLGFVHAARFIDAATRASDAARCPAPSRALCGGCARCPVSFFRPPPRHALARGGGHLSRGPHVAALRAPDTQAADLLLHRRRLVCRPPPATFSPRAYGPRRLPNRHDAPCALPIPAGSFARPRRARVRPCARASRRTPCVRSRSSRPTRPVLTGRQGFPPGAPSWRCPQSSLFLFYKIQFSTGCRWYRCDSARRRGGTRRKAESVGSPPLIIALRASLLLVYAAAIAGGGFAPRPSTLACACYGWCPSFLYVL